MSNFAAENLIKHHTSGGAISNSKNNINNMYNTTKYSDNEIKIWEGLRRKVRQTQFCWCNFTSKLHQQNSFPSFSVGFEHKFLIKGCSPCNFVLPFAGNTMLSDRLKTIFWFDFTTKIEPNLLRNVQNAGK